MSATEEAQGAIGVVPLTVCPSKIGTPGPVHGVACSMASGGDGVRLVSVDFVDCSDIRSQWQAYFSGRFPVGMDSLPYQDDSDREFFDRHWRGPKDLRDVPMTYDNFMLAYCWQHAPRIVVRKKSGKPFKSGSKTARVRRLVEHSVPPAMTSVARGLVTRMAYEFYDEEEGCVVNACMCEAVK